LRQETLNFEGDGMSTDNGNRPAMPVVDENAPPSDFSWVCGLTKREYFSIMAMQGFLSGTVPYHSLSDAAVGATQTADALLAALAKPQPTQ